MLISHKHKIAFYNIERNASTSLHHVLKDHLDVKFNQIKNPVIDHLMYHMHTTAEIYYSYILPFLPEDYYKCAIISHPARRLLSRWKCSYMYGETNLTLNDWIDDQLNKKNVHRLMISQVDTLTVNRKLYVNRLFDFNKMHLLEKFLSSIFGIPIFMPITNAHDLPDQILKKDLDRIDEIFLEDINLYNSIVDAGGELIINPYQH